MRLLGEYSTAYASNQFRAVRRFLRWLAAEQDRRDPAAVGGDRLIAGLRPGDDLHQQPTHAQPGYGFARHFKAGEQAHEHRQDAR